MPTRNANLTDHYDRFVEEQVASGRFTSASEVMRAGLRLLEQQTCEDQEKLTALRAVAAQAFDELDRGQAVDIDTQRQLANYIGEIGRRAAKQPSTAAESG